jgi:signal transduction histidine kinase
VTRPSSDLARPVNLRPGELAEDLPDLAALTGVRSGKRTYYTAYQRSNERLQRTVAAMDSISRALVHPLEGPRALAGEVARVAADHLQASWTVIALADGALPEARPRFLAVDALGDLHDGADALSPGALEELTRLRVNGLQATAEVDDSGWVRVRMTLNGSPVGGLAALPGLGEELEVADLSVLRILANLAAVSVHTSDLYQSGLAQQRRAQQLFEEVSEQARVLASRTEELRAAEQRLRVADQRELLDNERRRIALELHDSVAQTVLTAGLAVDVLRADAATLPGGEALATELDHARGLMVTATEQLRSVIYALHHARTAEDVASLPELLAEMAAQHRPHLGVSLRVEGRPVALGTSTEHALARTAGEALFNVAMHAGASRALVRLRYLADAVVLRISDDGQGDPAAMRRTVRLARRGAADGRHRGLVGMALRAEGLGGSLSIRRSRTGGVCVEARIPMARIPMTRSCPPENTQEGDVP